MNESKYYRKIDGKTVFIDPTKGGSVMSDFVKESLKDNGVVDTLQESTNWHTKFARYPYLDPYNALYGCKEYIFFTRPALNLLSPNGSLASSDDNDPVEWDLNNDEYLYEAYQRYPYLFDQWMCSKGPFMNMITNSVKSTLELPGANSKDAETAMNIYGSKITYRGTTWSSDEQFDFNLEFQDNKYLEMYNLFKIYDEYERLKAIGKVCPSKIYRRNRVLHDQFSVFKFVVGEDGREIIYYARAVGVFPTNFPRDSFGSMDGMIGSELKFTISFKGHFVRDMSPSIISHFNQLSLQNYTGGKTQFTVEDDMPLYVPSSYGSGSGNTTIYTGNRDMSWAARPLIVSEDYPGGGSHKPTRKYSLIWLNE